MISLQENIVADNIAWFRRWFDSTYYHKLYSHRSDEEARYFLDELIHYLQPDSGVSIIDVGCGNGRHSKYLASKGFQVTGIDLAFANIREARKSANSSLHFSRHDMRIPFGCAKFDYVFNFFTSFGYFNEIDQHLLVIRNMAEALKPGGVLVLDYVNTFYTVNNLVLSEQRETDGIIYHISRWAAAGHIYKRISIVDNKMPAGIEHTEKIARFELIDFEEMFAENNLEIRDVFGDYRMNEFEQHSSPRLIMVARKRACS